ncbi:hypothetical protein [Motiliproteus sp. MSK22-1]|uniref:phosphoribosylanthranilate isomerase n=1 Tax=Motiliproteus sp. MSK22-1 TaxID=1897630 RepID=UPI000975AD31|nr:hypothetical protein [Motiliproteus sp. MSK22-1]OMH29122.1 hypothetical protein BGP75_20435 [Motiliproteus sp. MSK22-1]
MNLKICGATSVREISLLDSVGVKFVGLWTSISGHKRNLDDDHFTTLATRCRRVKPVAVCVKPDIEHVANLCESTGVEWVQLHGFGPPSQVQEFNKRGLKVIKTLHVTDAGDCPEIRWLDDYDKAGVNVFLIDRFVDRQAIGSTGQSLPPRVLRETIDLLSGRHIWLGGGLNICNLADTFDYPEIDVIDIDNAARTGSIIGVRAIALQRGIQQQGASNVFQ